MRDEQQSCPAVYQQTRRWMAAGVFEAIVHDLRQVLRLAQDRTAEPTAAILDSRTRPSTPQSGAQAGDDGAKRRKGSKVHVAVDTLGHLLALHATPASAQDRALVGVLTGAVQAATGQTVAVAFVDQGYIGTEPAAEAATHGRRLAVVKLPAARHGFVLLPRRWVVECSFAWAARFRRLARDDEPLQTMLEGVHYLAVALPALPAALPILAVL